MQLNLPLYQHRIRTKANGKDIFDPIRQKYVALTPEEWVRQNFIQFLIQDRLTPASLIAVEVPIVVNQLNKRVDILVYSRQAKPLLAIECKAAQVPINQAVFDQLSRYNLEVKVPNLIITNGLIHYYCKLDLVQHSYVFAPTIPLYSQLQPII